MAEFHWVTPVPAPLSAVAAFHARPHVIRRLTPFVVPMTQHRMDPLDEGSISEFTLWFGPLPVRWTALHLRVGTDGFTDVQTEGPFEHWVHRHDFEADPRGGSRIVERIEYRHRPGRAGWITRLLFSRPMLWLLFTYRSLVMHLSLRRRSEPEPHAVREVQQ